MNKQQMLEILIELKKELAENTRLDKHQRQTMEALIDEINQRISDPELDMSGDQFLLSRLKSQTEKFEVSHPKLTSIIGRLSDLLARMGI